MKENDQLPKTICETCAEKLKICYEFKLLCENTNRKMGSTFYTPAVNTDNSHNLCNGNVNSDNSKVIIKIEKSSTDDEYVQQQKNNGFAEISLKCNYCQTVFHSCTDFQVSYF